MKSLKTKNFASLRTSNHVAHERSVAADVEKHTHGTKVQANFAVMNLQGFRLLLTACAFLLLLGTGCTTTHGTKGKCPTCPEWSVAHSTNR